MRRFDYDVKRFFGSEATPGWEKEWFRQKIAFYRLAWALKRPTWWLAMLTLGASLGAVGATVTAQAQPELEQVRELTTASMLVLVFAYACAWWLDGARAAKTSAMSGVLVFMGLMIFGGLLAKDGSGPWAALMVALAFSYMLMALNVTAAYMLTASVRASLERRDQRLG